MNPIETITENTLIPHTAFANASKQLEQCFRYANAALEPICLPIIGESRTGKSRCLESFLINHPRQRTAEGMCIPAFYVETPAKPTVKGLAEQMLRSLGDPKFDKGTEQAKTDRLLKLMAECKTRMVIVDEFQHFVDKGSSKIAYHVADWLKILADQSRVAIVVAGLPICTNVLVANEQLAGRFMAPILLPRFNWRNDKLRDEFSAILTAFHEQLAIHFDLPDLASDEMAFRCYCATGGLIGYLAKILRTAVWMAIDEERCAICLEDLEIAHSMSVGIFEQNDEAVSPFSRGFSLQPTTALLQRIAKIGTRVEQAISSRTASSRKSSTEMNLV